jgi:hypothetical protein
VTDPPRKYCIVCLAPLRGQGFSKQWAQRKYCSAACRREANRHAWQARWMKRWRQRLVEAA